MNVLKAAFALVLEAKSWVFVVDPAVEQHQQEETGICGVCVVVLLPAGCDCGPISKCGSWTNCALLPGWLNVKSAMKNNAMIISNKKSVFFL